MFGVSLVLTRILLALNYLLCLFLDKLKITKAWDKSDKTSLHAEGRAVTVELDGSNTAVNLASLAQYAVCAGVDYVKNEGITY